MMWMSVHVNLITENLLLLLSLERLLCLTEAPGHVVAAMSRLGTEY